MAARRLLPAVDRVLLLLLAAGRIEAVRALYCAMGSSASLGPALASLVAAEADGRVRAAALDALDDVPERDRPIGYRLTDAGERGVA